MKIVVLCGGLSGERNVSISGSTLICRALRSRGHRAVLVDMFFGLEPGTDLAGLFDALPELPDATVAEEAPDLELVRASRPWHSPSLVGQGVLEICGMADLVFLGLHGTCGEDGRIQAALDLLGIPYTGSGCLGSALAMDKHMTKLFAQQAGVRTPAWKEYSYGAESIREIMAAAELPCVVKPVEGGSSIGVSIARDRETLRAALEENLSGGRVLLEQYIEGREIDVAVLDDRALPAIEIIPENGFYDYRNKYQAGTAVEICPADIPAETEKALGEAALAVHRSLGLKAYSRSDFKLDANGELWFLEINTLPGMTPTSLLPQEAAVTGIDYETLCQTIVDLALREKGHR